MKLIYKCGAAIIALGLMITTPSWGQGPFTTTFNYTGAVQTYVVPAGVTTINIETYGAEGGTAQNDSSNCIIGGLGGYATGDLSVTPGETLNIYVGGRGYAGDIGGWNGGGNACNDVVTCAKGGGASDVRQGGTTLSDRVIVGGGGGGAEWSGCSGSAGDGGGLTGADGAHPTTGASDGKGGTQTTGGAAGTGSNNGTAGTFGIGGAGSTGLNHSGSGGGGWYGGGGSAEDGHGGGGSSYIGGVTNGSTTAGSRQGNGQILITALCSTTASETVNACGSYTVPSGDETHTTSGTYMDTIPNAAGCDSVITIDLTINSSTTGSDMLTICDSYTVPSGDETHTTSGTYMDTIPNAVGCDSVITIDLTILNSTTGSETVTACDSYTVPSGDESHTTSGSYMDTIPNAAGCDSIITIDLTVNTSTTGTDVQTACDSMVWIDGNTYTSSNNTATFTLTNAAGCDSVITMDLTILNTTTASETVNACGSYTVPSGDETYTSGGTYMDTIPNAAGCDSIITIDLTVNTSTTGTDVQTACDSMVWIDGNTYTSSNNTATFTLTNAAGCDSVVTLDLTVNTVNTSVTNNSPTLTADATSATYQWVSCDENYNPISGETDASYTALGNGNYAVIVTQNGCKDTSACEIVANIGLNNEDLADDINISPNPGSGKFYVKSNVMIEKITVIDNSGRIITTLNVNDEKTLVQLSEFAKGTYVMKITTAQGVITRNVIKQ